MSATLSITCPELSDEDIHDLTQRIRKDLRKEAGIESRMPEKTGEKGTRGDPVTIGQMVLTFLTSATAAGLVAVLKSYIDKKRSLSFEIDLGSDKKLKLDVENLSADQMGEAIRVLENLAGEN